jgi:acetylornithine deacetylase
MRGEGWFDWPPDNKGTRQRMTSSLSDQQQRIVDAVDAAFDAQIATTRDFVAIPSTRGAEGPCQDMFGDLLRARDYEVDDWHIDVDDLKDLRGFGPIEHDFSKARTVVGTLRPQNNGGKSLILQGHCDVVPAGPLDMWETPPFSPVVKDGKMFGRGACDMKSGTIGALYALDAIKAAGLQTTGRIHLQSVIEEESTGVGALSTLQRGYRADACFIPEPTNGKMVRSQVGVIWFRLKVRGHPVHVFETGAGANAITAAYHLIQSIEKLEEDWNKRAASDPHFSKLTHPINFNPGIIKGGDWASSVPAWCDVDCRIAVLPGWSIADCQKEIMACVAQASRDHRFLSNNPPGVEWSGFLSEGYELTHSAAPEAAFGKAFDAVYGGETPDLVFTALTDTRFYGLEYNIPSLCFGANGGGMHGFNEYVELDSLKKTTKAMALFVAEWCGVETI